MTDFRERALKTAKWLEAFVSANTGLSGVDWKARARAEQHVEDVYQLALHLEGDQASSRSDKKIAQIVRWAATRAIGTPHMSVEKVIRQALSMFSAANASPSPLDAARHSSPQGEYVMVPREFVSEARRYAGLVHCDDIAGNDPIFAFADEANRLLSASPPVSVPLDEGSSVAESGDSPPTASKSDSSEGH